MEGFKIGINFEGAFHDFETVFKGNVEGSPHLFRHLAEGTLASLNLLVEDFTAF